MIVLLKDDLMCATPYATFLRSLRLGRRPPAAGLATCVLSALSQLLLHALLAGHGLLRALARAGVGAGALAVHRQAPAVPDALVAADLDLALDVGGDLAAEVTLDLQVRVDP